MRIFSYLIAISIFLAFAFLYKIQIDKEKFVGLLKVYSASDENGKIQLKRYGRKNDGGYVVPEKAFKAADVLLGYGIADDNSFEENFSTLFGKPSYGFDCGIDRIATHTPLFTFVRECIANDDHLYSQATSSQKITSFNEHIKNLHLENKNIFIKMDIEGAEYTALEDILANSSKVTGIVLEVHTSMLSMRKAVKLLSQLEEKFVLVHTHGNNCSFRESFTTSNAKGVIPRAVELTFINKSLVKSYELASNQVFPQAIDQTNCPGYREAEFEIIT